MRFQLLLILVFVSLNEVKDLYAKYVNCFRFFTAHPELVKGFRMRKEFHSFICIYTLPVHSALVLMPKANTNCIYKTVQSLLERSPLGL